MNATEATHRRRSITRYSDEDREQLMEEHARSGLTKKDFCEQYGINTGTFHGWFKRKRDKASGKSPEFAEVEVSSPTMSAAIEVLLPNGARIGVRHQGKQSELISLVRGLAGAGRRGGATC